MMNLIGTICSNYSTTERVRIKYNFLDKMAYRSGVSAVFDTTIAYIVTKIIMNYLCGERRGMQAANNAWKLFY